MIESQEEISKNNQEHYKRLAQAEAFVKSGNKINVIPSRQKSDILPSTINKKSRPKPSDDLILAGKKPVEKIMITLEHYKKLTRKELGDYTGLSTSAITKWVNKLEADGFLVREYKKEVTFKVVKKC